MSVLRVLSGDSMAEELEPDRGTSRPVPYPLELTSRDLEVLRLLADGLTILGIAEELGYSPSTIKNEVHVISRHLGARNRAHAVALAIRAELI